MMPDAFVKMSKQELILMIENAGFEAVEHDPFITGLIRSQFDLDGTPFCKIC